jgi:hypothetical protein
MPKYLTKPNEYGYHASVTGYLPPHEAEGLTKYTGQTLPCWPDGTPLTEQELADIEAQREQARLQQVATDYAVPLQQFADAWAETGVETVPESWGDALTLLGQSGAGSDVFCRLLALRFGPLAPVWDDVLVIMNGGI